MQPISTEYICGNNYVKRTNHEKNEKPVVIYENSEIPVENILCVRDAWDNYGSICPKSRITMLEDGPNPENPKIATEYEYLGSAQEWTDACEKAKRDGRTRMYIDYFG